MGGSAAVDWTERVLREYVLSDVKPDVVLNWFTEPDGSRQGALSRPDRSDRAALAGATIHRRGVQEARR